MKKIVLFICLVILSKGYSQSLEDLISNSKDKLKTATTLKSKSKLSADLAWYYCHVNVDSALVYGNESLRLSKETKNDTLIGQSLNDLSTVYFVRGDYPKAINLAKKSLKYRKKLSDTAGIASLYNKLGNNYNKTNVLDSTIYYYLKARDFYLKQSDSLNSYLIESNIASTYYTSGSYDKALKYLDKSIAFFQKNSLKRQLSNSYVTLGNISLSKTDTIKAIGYFEKAEEVATEAKNYVGLASALNNLSTIYNGLNDIDKSTSYIKRAIEIRESIGALGDLESAKLTLAMNNFTLGKIKQSKEILYQIKPYLKKTKANDKLQNLYETLMLIHAFEKNIDSLNFYSKVYKQTLNTNIGETNLKYSQEIEAKYETEKKEKEIIIQRAALAENKLNLNRKNIQLLGLGIVAVLLSILGYLLYNQQKLRNKQLQKEAELKQALVRIETQNKLQEQRLRISRDLHDNIGAQLTFIISSIENLQYGFNIKNEKLNKKLVGISAFTKDTIYELRDTIWAMNKSEISLEDLQTRISNFVEKADKHSEAIQFQFLLSDNIVDEIIFTSVKGMNIYRIVQEAIHNAIKYADAKNISVKVSKESNQLCIDIVDDGKGFDVNGVSDGNGLNNIRKRAKDINASIAIESEIHNGTSILLGVPC